MGKLSPKRKAELAARVRVDVLVPGDEGYESSRKMWNGMFDRMPAVIVRCVGAAAISAW